LQQLHGDGGERDAQQHGRADAVENHPAAALRRELRRHQADDNGVVASQHQVDDDDLNEFKQRFEVHVGVAGAGLNGGDGRGIVREYNRQSPDSLPSLVMPEGRETHERKRLCFSPIRHLPPTGAGTFLPTARLMREIPVRRKI